MKRKRNPIQRFNPDDDDDDEDLDIGGKLRISKRAQGVPLRPRGFQGSLRGFKGS